VKLHSGFALEQHISVSHVIEKQEEIKLNRALGNGKTALYELIIPLMGKSML